MFTSQQKPHHLSKTKPWENLGKPTALASKFLSEKRWARGTTGCHQHSTSIWGASATLTTAQTVSQDSDNKTNHLLHKVFSDPVLGHIRSRHPWNHCSWFRSLWPHFQSPYLLDLIPQSNSQKSSRTGVGSHSSLQPLRAWNRVFRDFLLNWKPCY